MILTWQAVGVIAAILVNAGMMVWWASKLTSKMENVNNSLVKLDKELEKRDARIDAAWKKLDRHEHRLTVVETKCKIQLPEAVDE
jgi:hypothetical protein